MPVLAFVIQVENIKRRTCHTCLYIIYIRGQNMTLSGMHTSNSEFVNLVDLCNYHAFIIIWKHCKAGVLKFLTVTSNSSIFIVTF